MVLDRLHSSRVFLLYYGLQITAMHVHVEELSDLVQREHPWVAVVGALSVCLRIWQVVWRFPLHHDLILESQFWHHWFLCWLNQLLLLINHPPFYVLNFLIYPRQLVPCLLYLPLFVSEPNIQFISECFELARYQGDIVLQCTQLVVCLSHEAYRRLHVPVQVEAHADYDGRDVVPLVDVMLHLLILEWLFDRGLPELQPVFTVRSMQGLLILCHLSLSHCLLCYILF